MHALSWLQHRRNIAALGGTLILAFGVFLSTPFQAEGEEPSPASGSWSWSWKDTAGATHHHVLEIEGIGSKLAGRERFDDSPAVKVTDLTFKERKLHFKVTRKERVSEYQGALSDDGRSIEGLVIVTIDGQSTESPWKAMREEVQKTSP